MAGRPASTIQTIIGERFMYEKGSIKFAFVFREKKIKRYSCYRFRKRLNNTFTRILLFKLGF